MAWTDAARAAAAAMRKAKGKYQGKGYTAGTKRLSLDLWGTGIIAKSGAGKGKKAQYKQIVHKENFPKPRYGGRTQKQIQKNINKDIGKPLTRRSMALIRKARRG